MPFIRYKDKNILFVHVPKTGGTTIDRWLEQHGGVQFLDIHPVQGCCNCSPQHFMAGDILRMFSHGYFDFIFAIVRNPYARLESEYRWQERTNKDIEPFPLWLATSLQEYITTPWVADNHFRPQVEFLCKEVRTYRFEDGMEQIMRSVAQETGLPLNNDFARRCLHNQHFSRTIEWSDELRAPVNSIYAEDFAALGYPRLG